MATDVPGSLQSFSEECIKAFIYAALVAHATASLFEKTLNQSWLSLAVHVIVVMLSGKALIGELHFLLLERPNLPPGSLGLPFFGDFFPLATRYNGGLLPMSFDKAQLYGNVYINMILGRTLITLSDSASLTWLWSNDRKSLTESSWPPNIQALLGSTAIANLHGTRHKILRRLMEPFYSPTFVANYLTVMVETTDDDLEEWCNTGDVVSGEVFKLYALRLFMVSSFGQVDRELVETLHDDYKQWISGFLTLTGTLRVPGWTFDKAMKARDRILGIIEMLIERFLLETPEDSERAKTTVMGRMIYAKGEDGERLSVEEIKDNLLNLIFAGHDTTYASINTVLHHVSQNPDAEAALVEEVCNFREPLDLDEIKKAPILNAVMHESWRVDPPVGFAFRKSVKSSLEYRNYKFPKGTTFSYNIGLAVRQENVYPSAQSFHMERYLPKDHPLANSTWESTVDPNQGRADYPIFGGGTHVCLGKHFAKLELRIIMARLYKNYHVTVKNNRKVYMPVNGWAVDFQLKRKTTDRRNN
jgi:retinoid hydroxylase